MTNTTERPSARAAGFVALTSAAATIALLAFHPESGAHDFAGVLREEAAGRATDAVVHGGFIAVLAVQTACYAVLSQRVKGLAGLVFFAFGAAFLSASMVLDGLVTPALAARYLAAPEKIEYARALFVLVGTLIGWLMPIGLAFQAAAIAAWGFALRGMARVAAVLLGGAMLAGLVTGSPVATMGALGGTVLWAALAGMLMAMRRV
jgi:hypothetical protein